MRFSFLCFLAICTLVAATPSRRGGYVVHESRAAEPVAWAKTRRLEAHNVIPLRIGLTQQNMHQLQELLMSVSHPGSPTFGQHWSPERVVEHFAPSEDTVSKVKNWLIASGFNPGRIRVSHNKGWIDVNATTAEVEYLLDTEYHIYTHSSGHVQISCESYSVPDYIREHVDLIKPTVHFAHHLPDDPAHLRKRSNNKSGSESPSSHGGSKTNYARVIKPLSMDNCDEYITPDCLRELYQINHTPVVPNLNSYGIVEFTPQAYIQSDLNLFFRNFSKSYEFERERRPNIVSIDGGVAQQSNKSFDYNGESNLNLEYAMELTEFTPITLLQTGDLVEGAGFGSWLDAVDGSYCKFNGGDDPSQDKIYPDNLPGGFDQPESCGIIKPPYVVSISYGQDESSVTAKYAKRQCDEYAKLGMMGTTVLYSSGDWGVAGSGGLCLSANGTANQWGIKFNPIFPASCPFVTAVGATQVNPGSTVYEPESACEQQIFSGGGFSNIFDMPAYQKHAVSKYLKHHAPPYTAEQFNNSGQARGFPDLSANGANYVVAVDGNFTRIFGTSASAPVVGAIITLINDARIDLGKGPIGFLNELIYDPDFSCAFNDITSGHNPGCGTTGFPTAPGWDPVTGVGTLNMKLLLPKFLALP